jgi:hypothetical protein
MESWAFLENEDPNTFVEEDHEVAEEGEDDHDIPMNVVATDVQGQATLPARYRKSARLNGRQGISYEEPPTDDEDFEENEHEEDEED